MNFSEIENYLYSRIKDKIDIGYSAGFSLERVKYTLELLGNPQEKVKVIHIAGTSGKGSTATFISKLLQAHGFRTGLTLSPHINDIRERVQINNRLINRQVFAQYFNEILPIFQEVEISKYSSLSYFEMIICLAYYTFWKEKTDYTVIETGLGGTYDATNCVSNPEKVCVITRIGYDHIKILGDSIEEITNNKVGIIRKYQHTIFLSQDIPNSIIKNKIDKEDSTFTEVKIEEWIDNDDNLIVKNNKLIFSNLPDYQKENLSMAIATVEYISERDNWEINLNKIIEIAKDYKFEGRFELVKRNNINLILDGAHNPQKMSAFSRSLVKKFPHTKFQFVIAFKYDKDVPEMLNYIIPLANKILITSFESNTQDISHKSYPTDEIANLIHTQNYSGEVIVEKNITRVLNKITNESQQNTSPIIVTGSLYLVSEFKKLLSNTLPL